MYTVLMRIVRYTFLRVSLDNVFFFVLLSFSFYYFMYIIAIVIPDTSPSVLLGNPRKACCPRSFWDYSWYCDKPEDS